MKYKLYPFTMGREYLYKRNKKTNKGGLIK